MTFPGLSPHCLSLFWLEGKQPQAYLGAMHWRLEPQHRWSCVSLTCFQRIFQPTRPWDKGKYTVVLLSHWHAWAHGNHSIAQATLNYWNWYFEVGAPITENQHDIGCVKKEILETRGLAVVLFYKVQHFHKTVTWITVKGLGSTCMWKAKAIMSSEPLI